MMTEKLILEWFFEVDFLKSIQDSNECKKVFLLFFVWRMKNLYFKGKSFGFHIPVPFTLDSNLFSKFFEVC